MPNHKWSATLEYDLEIASAGLIRPGVTYSYTGERYSLPLNTPIAILSAYDRWDARLSWFSPEGRFSVTGYVQNVTNEIGIMELAPRAWDEGYAQDGLLSNPRTYGLVLRYEM